MPRRRKLQAPRRPSGLSWRQGPWRRCGEADPRDKVKKRGCFGRGGGGGGCSFFCLGGEVVSFWGGRLFGGGGGCLGGGGDEVLEKTD